MDIDRDEDSKIDQQQPTGEQQIMQHMTAIGQNMVAAIQQGTETMIGRLNDIAEAGTASQNSRYDTRVSQDQGPNIAQLQAQIGGLSADLQVQAAFRADSDERVRALEKRNREQEVNLQKHKAEVTRLKSIIVKSGMPQTGPTDDQLRAAFCAIRDSILRLVRVYFQAQSMVFNHSRKESPSIKERQNKWLGFWAHERPEIRNYRVQGAIFEIINECFFAKKFFDVDAKDIETLRYLEGQMEHCPQISKVDCVEWRRRTVMATSALGQTNGDADRVALKILATMEPALTQSRHQSPRKYEQLERDMVTLCGKALQLLLDFRESKAFFKVVVPELADYLNEVEMELVAVEGKETSARPRVEWIVFGGLRKTTPYTDGLEETILLEKSQVVGRIE